MKRIYKTLVLLGMLCLLSTNTTAQIVQYSNDGTISCIECPGVEDFFVPLFFLPSNWTNWRDYIPADTAALEQWLQFQEVEMARLMTGNYNLQYGDITNFNNLQRPYFLNLYHNTVVGDYIPRMETELDNRANYDASLLSNSTTNFTVLNHKLYNQEVDQAIYGDLKYEGEYIRDIRNYDLVRMVEREERTRNEQREGHNQVRKNNAYLNFISNNADILTEYLAERMIDHYNDLNPQDRIIWMSSVIAGNQGFGQYQTEILNSIWEVTDTDYLNPFIDTMFAQDVNYPVTNWSDLPIDEGLFRWASRDHFNTKARSVINNNDQTRYAVKNYIRAMQYPEASMQLINDMMTAFHDNQAFPFDAHPIGPSYEVEFNHDFGDFNPNILAKFRIKTETGSAQREFYRMDYLLGNLRHHEYAQNREVFFGSFISQLLEVNNIDKPDDITDANLNTMFHLDTNLPDDTVLPPNGTQTGSTFLLQPNGDFGSILWDNGVRFPDLLQNPFETEATLALANGGEVDFFDEVILDSSFINTKAYCVYNELKRRNGNLFRQTIGSFIDDPKYNLYFRVGQCSSTDQACTDADSIELTKTITIILENTNIESLNAAAILLHEGIHAELFRFVDQAHNGEVNPNDRKLLFDLYRNYAGLNTDDMAQHSYMSLNYVTPIAKAIRALDNNKYPLDYYMGFGWDGLRAYDYTGILSNEESNQLYHLQAEVNENTTFNPQNCN